ncbi:MAG: FAD:protein FMN transferase [Gammaproteobacteria bacterium]|nr:FAD:protein FMN transferase [Gammaproteobacteria bacterium]MBT4147365.1 FAD:protein FMN transferase [Gammaproteobacteria bacterium]MBT5222567.1 FAD:protein FMN transferase [Gammaproteobacteria bacterium]MBT5826073.1 FAD:protein FMN transferase [Gammaproteobacteria bacterium]MBT5967346.1 FAD:protein FMN transferase [Gammaproteobacteria bacterium]
MGTACTIQLYAQNTQLAKNISAAVITDVNRLELKYSRYRSDSLLSKINRLAAKGGKTRVDDETVSLLNYATTCYQQSGGLFDITSGILRHIWQFQQHALPDEQQIAAIRNRIGWQRVNWSAPHLEFPEPGFELDFGGIVKEYAVDRAAIIAQESGMQYGIINLGGDIRVVGPHANGQPWVVGIQHPREQQQVIQKINLSQGALASSGDYERCIVVNNQRYGHVFNPRTGWPVSHLAAVSVVSELCVVAGSAATIAMLKESLGTQWLAQLGLPYLWVDVQGKSGGSLLDQQD